MRMDQGSQKTVCGSNDSAHGSKDSDLSVYAQPGRSARDCRGFAPAGDLKFPEQVVHVVLHSGDLDAKPNRDLLVREPSFDEGDDVLLTASEGQICSGV